MIKLSAKISHTIFSRTYLYNIHINMVNCKPLTTFWRLLPQHVNHSRQHLTLKLALIYLGLVSNVFSLKLCILIIFVLTLSCSKCFAYRVGDGVSVTRLGYIILLKRVAGINLRSRGKYHSDVVMHCNELRTFKAVTRLQQSSGRDISYERKLTAC